MCQLALDMFGRTLRERHISYSFRYENYARFFHKKCSVCHITPYLPVAADVTIHGLAWSLDFEPYGNTVAANFQPICIRCAVLRETHVGFWIPTTLASKYLSYLFYDGRTLSASRMEFLSYPNSEIGVAVTV